jgi:hypothetical protein
VGASFIANAYSNHYDSAMAYQVKSARRYVGLIVVVLWVASLALPVATFVNGAYGYCPGFLVAGVGLIFGWAALQFGAFANLILLVLCGLLFFKRRASMIAACIMEILALTSFTWNDFPSDAGSNPIAHFDSGFYVWQVAILLLTIYALGEKRFIASGKIIA